MTYILSSTDNICLTLTFSTLGEGSNLVENQSLGRISSSDIIANLLTRLSSMEK